MSQEVLLKNNNLIKIKANMDSNEYKLFNHIFTKVQTQVLGQENQNIDNIPELLKCPLTISEIRNVYKDNNNVTIKGIYKIINQMMDRKVEFIKYNSNKLISTRLILKQEIDLDQYDFNVYLFKDVYLYLKDYKANGGYTSIDISVQRKYKSFYSQRFLELFRHCANQNKCEITLAISQIKDMFLIGDRYSQYGDFKKRVIVMGINEINKSGAMNISFKENKLGRVVNSITFQIKDNNPKVYDFSFKRKSLQVESPEPESKSKARQLSSMLRERSFKLAESTIIKMFKQYGESEVTKAIGILCNKKERVSAPKKYIEGIINNLSSTVGTYEAPSKPKLKTANFTQRNYDYVKLEQQLLGWDIED